MSESKSRTRLPMTHEYVLAASRAQRSNKCTTLAMSAEGSITPNAAASPPTNLRYEFLDAAFHEFQIHQEIVDQRYSSESFTAALRAGRFGNQDSRIWSELLSIEAWILFGWRLEVRMRSKEYFLALVVKVGTLGDPFQVRQNKLFRAKGCPEHLFRRQGIYSRSLHISPDGRVWSLKTSDQVAEPA